MREMDRWLQSYEKKRLSKQGSKESWQSNWQSDKYDFTDPNVRNEYVPEMNCSVGACISALKGSWRSFEIAGRNGEPRGDLAYRINYLKDILGLPLTEFEEYPGIYQSQEEGANEPYMEEWASMSEEEKQAYREEKAEERNDDW